MHFYSVVSTMVAVVSLVAFLGFAVYLLVAVKSRAAKVGALGIGLLILGRFVPMVLTWAGAGLGVFSGGSSYAWWAVESVIGLLFTIGGIGLLVMGIAVAAKQQGSRGGRYGTGTSVPSAERAVPTSPEPDAPWGQQS